MFAIEIEIKRSVTTGKSRVKVVMDGYWSTYWYDYGVAHDEFALHYAKQFIKDVNENKVENNTGGLIPTDNLKAASTRNGWVVLY